MILIKVKNKKMNAMCPICYENINSQDEIKQNCCGQKFHKKCLTSWFLKKKVEKCCPYCRSSCDFNTGEIKEELYSKPLTRSKYKMFEKIYCHNVRTLLNKCEVQKNREDKTKTMIEVMETVFEHPLILINKPIFNKTVKAKIDELRVDNKKNRDVINKETYYRAVEILENSDEIYETYLSYFNEN